MLYKSLTYLLYHLAVTVQCSPCDHLLGIIVTNDVFQMYPETKKVKLVLENPNDDVSMFRTALTDVFVTAVMFEHRKRTRNCVCRRRSTTDETRKQCQWTFVMFELKFNSVTKKSVKIDTVITAFANGR